MRRPKIIGGVLNLGTKNKALSCDSFGGLMLNSEEYRQIAEQYRERANSEKSTRLANVLLSVSNAYLVLASQLDLLASVERQESARIASGNAPSTSP
ncbi:hypothetical protein [Bradyrhizobium sp.]|uniref:hypothetical protein n=1 Tax=Bradyrhizobium sp. TaxID=376 RepID=UPI000AE0AD76|nr:hypothetical protein [Bradyrhizobium sp.]